MASGQGSLSPHTAPVNQTGKQWCPYCNTNVNWIIGAISKKAICTLCGHFTSVITGHTVPNHGSNNPTYNSSFKKSDATTEPMIPVAKKQEEDMVDMVYCSKCGTHYSTGKCESGHEERFVKRV